MFRKAIITLFVIGISGTASQAQCEEQFSELLSDDFTHHTDIYFGENIAENGELYSLLLDVFEPADAPDDGTLRPLVILIHGGSFTGGSKEMGEVVWFCEDLARRGIVAASINYRTESNPLSLLSQEKMVKAVIRGVEDTKAAIRFFYRSADEGNPWQIDTDAIIVGGTSAGSICGLHAVYMDDYAELRPNWQRWLTELGIDSVTLSGNSGNSGYPEKVAGVINISGAVARTGFLDNNADIPILNVHNTIDLSIPYMYGHPYFIPTLPVLAGSRPIHYRMLDNGGQSTLLAFEELNHLPHTVFGVGSKQEPEYSEILDGMLSFIGGIAPCDQLPTGIAGHHTGRLGLYPNPASSFLYLEDRDETLTFNLHDLQGRLAARLKFNGGRAVLPKALENGLYFLSGMLDGELHSGMVVVER